MKSFDDKLRAQAQSEEIRVPRDFDARMEKVLSALPQWKRSGSRYLRVALVAAVVCALLGVTAWAYVTGAFDFLKGREEYQFLGRTEVYEKYAKPVNLTQTAENGDVLTIESMAMDGNFCTLVYTVHTVEKMASWSDISEGISKDAPELWQAMVLNPGFTITAGGADISTEQTGQQFLAEGQTLYGMVRVLLSRPLEPGESYTLRVAPSVSEVRNDAELNSVADLKDIPDKWSFTLTADPIETKRVELSRRETFMDQWDSRYEVELVSLSRSPLGTVLDLRLNIPEEYREDPGLYGFSFVLRDADTGAYITYTPLESDYRDGVRQERFELYGDLSGLRALELVPVQLSGTGTFVTAPLNELPVRMGDVWDEISSVKMEENQIVVTERTAGMTNGTGALDFLDAQGERLFHGEGSPQTYVSRFIDWTDGSIINTYSLTDVPKDYVERITQVRFLVSGDILLEDQAVTIALE